MKNQCPELFKNHRESVRIIQESLRINENQGLDLFENQQESIPDLFENRWESGFRLIWESSRIIQESIPDSFRESVFRIIRESSRNWQNQSGSGFRIIWESIPEFLV